MIAQLHEALRLLLKSILSTSNQQSPSIEITLATDKSRIKDSKITIGNVSAGDQQNELAAPTQRT